MNLFDRLLDTFSAKDLNKRVDMVVLSGIIAFLVAAAGGYLILTKNFSIGINGVVSDAQAGSEQINVSLDHADLERLPMESEIEVEFKKNGQRLSYKTKITSIDPKTGVISIEPPNLTSGTDLTEHAEVELIISEGPLWKLLFTRN